METLRFASSTILSAIVEAFPEEVTSPVRLALVVTVAALPVVLPELPDIDGAVIAPVVTAPDVVIVDDPILIFPNPDVIEPTLSAPTSVICV